MSQSDQSYIIPSGYFNPNAIRPIDRAYALAKLREGMASNTALVTAAEQRALDIAASVYPESGPTLIPVEAP